MTTATFKSSLKVTLDSDYNEWTIVNEAGEIEDYFTSEKDAQRAKIQMDRDAEREFLVSEIDLDALTLAQLRAIAKLIAK